MKPKFDMGAIENWGLLLTSLFVIVSMIYESRNTFASSFFMNMAFTIFGGVIIALLLNRLLNERESARWSAFDIDSLMQVQNTIYSFLYHGLLLVTFHAALRENLNIPSEGTIFLEFNTRNNLERFQKHAAELHQHLNFLYKNHRITLGKVGLERQKDLLGELDRIDEAMRYIIISPYVPVDSLAALQKLSEWKGHLRDYIRNDWNLKQDQQAEMVALSLVKTVEYALDAYTIIFVELSRRAQK